jgi:hypothetical protein
MIFLRRVFDLPVIIHGSKFGKFQTGEYNHAGDRNAHSDCAPALQIFDVFLDIPYIFLPY